MKAKIMECTGRLVKDAEVSESQYGKYARFTLACNSQKNGEKLTSYVDVYCKNPTVYEGVLNYLKKGRLVKVRGSHNIDLKVTGGKYYVNERITSVTEIEPQGYSRLDENSEEAITAEIERLTARRQAIAEGKVSGNAPEVPVEPKVVEHPTAVPVGASVNSIEDDLPF